MTDESTTTAQAAIHPDLKRSDPADPTMLGLGLLGIPFGGLFIWIGVVCCINIWADIKSGRASIFDGDWFVGLLMTPVFLALGLATFVAAVLFIIAWAASLSGELSESERKWRLAASSVYATAHAASAQFQVQESRWGGGIRGGPPTFQYEITVQGAAGMAIKPSVEQVVEIAAASAGKRPILQTSDTLLGKLFRGHSKGQPRVDIPNKRLGSKCISTPIVAVARMDNQIAPRVIILECEGLRIWCSNGQLS